MSLSFFHGLRNLLNRIFSGNSHRGSVGFVGRTITFFCFTDEEVHGVQPIIKAATKRGCQIKVERDMDAHADIGFYCHHSPNPNNSRFCIVMLHDLGQEYWPEDMTPEINHWTESNWDNSDWSNFDIAFLPGRSWSEAWRLSNKNPRANPRLGVFEVGYPKSDIIYDVEGIFLQHVKNLSLSLSINNLPTILFAPSWETENFRNLRTFVSAFDGLEFNLLVKYWPTFELPSEYRSLNFRYVDPNQNILECLALADIVVSDESNCLAEALLFGIPPVAVSDWKVPAMPHLGLDERNCAIPPWAIRTDSERLRATVLDLLEQKESVKSTIVKERQNQFSFLGRSSELVMDIIEASVKGRSFPINPLK